MSTAPISQPTHLPLKGLRILSVEQYGAGPFGTQNLADLGAEVIKVENHRDGGDIGRHVGPHFFSEGDSHFYEAFNRGKRSVALDLKAEGSREVLHALVKQVDAVFDNLRGDLPAKLGLDYAALGPVNPKIVCVHLSAYGRTGSRASWPGYDYLMQSEAGFLSMTGEPDGPPARFGLSIVDYMTGTTAAMALLAGVLDARQTGKGRDLDTCLYDVALSNLGYISTWYLNGGAKSSREPRSSHPSLTPSQLYKTADGWLFVMCQKEKFWQVFATLVGHPEWLQEPAFATFKDRLKNRPQLNDTIDGALQARTTDEWMALLGGKVPAAPVYDVAQALDAAYAAEQERVIDYHHPDHGRIRGVAGPVRLQGVAPPTEAAPTLGRDTDAVLREAGFGEAAIAAFREARVVA